MPASLSAFCLSPYPIMSTRALTYSNYPAQHIPQTPTFITHTAAPYRSLPYPHIIILHTDIPLSCSNIRYPPYRIPNTLTLHTRTQLSLQIAPTIPTSSTNYHMKLEMELVSRIRLFSSVRYCILPSAVWCIPWFVLSDLGVYHVISLVGILSYINHLIFTFDFYLSFFNNFFKHKNDK